MSVSVNVSKRCTGCLPLRRTLLYVAREQFLKHLMFHSFLNFLYLQLEKLFSDIGGQLGLWIGVSVATLYESIESLTIVFISIMKWIQTRRLKLRAISPLPVTSPAVSYKVDAARNSVSRDSVHYPFQFDTNEVLGSSASRTSSRFLHVHFKDSEVT